MLIEADSHSALISLPEESKSPAIYSKYFGFLQFPFSSLPKKEFFFEHVSATQMINTVTFSLTSGESIVKVTGETGVGKSYLIRQIMSSLGEDYYTINVTAPNLSANVFLKYLVEELGAAYPLDANDAQLLKFIQFLLCEHYSKTDYRIVVWVDDAHKLPDETLEVIAALSKMETSHRSLLQFVISGSHALDSRLASERMADLKGKIGFSSELTGLTFAEMKTYVQERLKIVDADNPACFSHSALSALYKKTSGIPAKINKLSHKSLMLAFGKGDEKIKKSHIWKAAVEDEYASVSKGHVAYWLMVVPSVMAMLGLFVSNYLGWFSL